jgi:hypothetical protein
MGQPEAQEIGDFLVIVLIRVVWIRKWLLVTVDGHGNRNDRHPPFDVSGGDQGFTNSATENREYLKLV